ncbi:MAG TPA: DNA glycosylase [Methanocorpusculum sp.]|nr:DNA glycosylase [Methanocorpusculum sp.]
MQEFPLDGIWFNLDLSLSCGQAFRWRKHSNGFWYAPSPYGNHSVWKLKLSDGCILYSGMDESDLIRYFSLDHDLKSILESIDSDPVIHNAIQCCRGLRILRQDPWECLISYICSTCSNIPGIQQRIELISQKFGVPITFDNQTFYTFPTISEISNASYDELRDCKVGFRAQYILDAIQMALKSPNWSSNINKLAYPDANIELRKINGVGPKVADCVLLFSFEKLESVPIDVWIERIIRTKYFDGKKIGYTKASKYAREHFGKYAGYAQEYLFAAREIISQKGI